MTPVARWERAAMVGARVLVGALFLAGAVQKAVDPDAVRGLLRGIGLPGALVWPALLYDAAAAMALLAGWRLVPVALSLAAYCAFTSLFHFLPDDPWQMTIFVKNWAIAGGCLALAVAARRV